MSGENGSERRPRGRRWVKRILLTLLGLFVLGCLGLGFAYATIQTPNPNQLAGAQASIVYYDDGKTELARLADPKGNRQSVPLSQVPGHLQKAVLAAEDRSFYSNKGVSPSGIARAVWHGLRGGQTQGGSTITQQYVKNYFLTADQTPSRKFKEILLSVKVDQQESKDVILENYLNTIYYGRGAYGVQTAARAYFGKDVGQLSVAEGAVLASVINAPSLYDPALGAGQQKRLAERFGYVLDGMVDQGWLTPPERATQQLPQTIAAQPSKALVGPQGYIVDSVRKELKAKLGLSDSDIDRGGLRVTTTISKKAQDAAVKAMDDNMPKDPPDLYAGLVAVRPGDGAVVAMYGGKDYQARQFSSATDAVLQAGSTFKPFALVAALQKGISTKTRFNGDSPIMVPGLPRGIPNEGNVDFGMVDLRRATAKSINTVFVGLNQKIGPPATRQAAIAAGIPEQTSGLGTDLTNVLGTSSPRVSDVANAYATIAAEGQLATPHVVARVTSDEVSISYSADNKTVPAFPKEVAADVVDAMQQVTAPGGTGSRAARLGRPVAGKTGTSDEHKSVWFTGFVPQLSASVGMFKDVGGVPQPLANIAGIDELSGNSIPLSIWNQFMIDTLQGEKVLPFPKRAGIGDNQVAPPPSTVTVPPSTTATSVPTTPTTPPPTTPPPPTSPSTTTTQPPTTPPPSTTTTQPPTTSTRPPPTTTPPPPTPRTSTSAPR